MKGFVPRIGLSGFLRRAAVFIPWAAVFLLGAITGAVCINLAIGAQLDKVYMENINLRDINGDQEAQIEALRKEMKERQDVLVKETKVYVLNDEKFMEIEIEKHIKSFLQELNGKPVDKLDPILVANMIDQRVLEIDNISYTLEVKALLISEKILVYVDAKENK